MHKSNAHYATATPMVASIALADIFASRYVLGDMCRILSRLSISQRMRVLACYLAPVACSISPRGFWICSRQSTTNKTALIRND